MPSIFFLFLSSGSVLLTLYFLFPLLGTKTIYNISRVALLFSLLTDSVFFMMNISLFKNFPEYKSIIVIFNIVLFFSISFKMNGIITYNDLNE